MSRSILASLLFLLVSACAGSGPQKSTSSAVDPEPATNIVEIAPERPRRIRLTSQLSAGQTTVRDCKLEIEARFPPGLGGSDDLSFSRTYRHRLSLEHVLGADGGKPSRIRRTYNQTQVREEVQRADGRTSRITTNPLAGVTLVLTSGDGPEETVRVETDSPLPYGVDTDQLAQDIVLDVISLSRWLPKRTIARGETWSIPPIAIVDLFGRARPGCRYEGQITARYDRPVLYDGERAAHIGLKIRITQVQIASQPARFRKKTNMAIDGALYYSLQSGRPLFIRLHGPLQIDFEPLDENAPVALSRPARCAGTMAISIGYRLNSASSSR